MENVPAKNNSAIRDKRLINFMFYVVMAAIAVILIFPYFYMVMKSLMTSEEVVGPVKIFPDSPQFVNYVRLFSQNGYLKALINTMFVIVFNLIAVPLSASIIAFSFAKLNWKGKNLMFALMLGTIMLPSIITQIPLYIMYTRFNWINTFWPLTIPNLFGGGAINIFLLRQFMKGIPRDMDEAAKIDGASTFRRFISITFPLCKPVLTYIMVTIFIANWGDFYGPLVFMNSSNAPRTLAYVLFLDSTEKDAATYKSNMRMSGGVFMSLIPAGLFWIFQRELINGIVMTGVKG